MTTATAPPKAHPARQKAIQPYLDQLQGWCCSPAGSKNLDRPAKISIGRQQLVIDSWERGLLQQFFQGTEAGLPGLLAHGVALVIKSTLDVERLKKHASNASVEIYALQAELMLDTAIGMALLHETDLAIAAEVQGGGVDMAKSLTLFRHKLYRSVADAKKRIADSERQQAEALAGSMTDQPFTAEATVPGAPVSPARALPAADPAIQTLIEEAAAAAADDDPVPRSRRRRRRPSAGAPVGKPMPLPKDVPGRTGLLALATAVLAVVWVVAVQLPPLLGSDMVVIDRSQIAGETDLSVRPRPPSLFVTLPASQWEALDEVLREDLIDSISAAASREGYTGALLTTDAGRPVARWLWSRGVEFLGDPESRPAALESAPESTSPR